MILICLMREIDTALYDEVKAIETKIDEILERSELREGLRQILALSSGEQGFRMAAVEGPH